MNAFVIFQSVHGSYRSVEETDRAISIIGETLQVLGASSVLWLFDRPVSNSGRLASKIAALAVQRDWPWQVEVVFNPDSMIVSSSAVAITSDSSVLDRVERWRPQIIFGRTPNPRGLGGKSFKRLIIGTQNGKGIHNGCQISERLVEPRGIEPLTS